MCATIFSTHMKNVTKTLLALSLPVMAFAALRGINKTVAWFVPSYLIVFDGLKGEGDILENEVNSNLILEDGDILNASENTSIVVSEEALTGSRYYNINFKAKGNATLSYKGSAITTVTTEDWSEYTYRFFVSATDEDAIVDVVIEEGNSVLLDDVNVILASKILTAGATIGELPELPAKEGYTGIAWTIDGVELTPESTYTYGASRLAYAKYEINTYTVTFEGVELDPVVVNYGETIEQPEEPVKDGYNFVGWYNGESAFDFNAPITEDVTITAVFEEIPVEPEEEEHCCCPHKHHHDHHHHHNPAFCDENKKSDNGKHKGQDNGKGNKKDDKTNNGKDNKSNNGKGNVNKGPKGR